MKKLFFAGVLQFFVFGAVILLTLFTAAKYIGNYPLRVNLILAFIFWLHISFGHNLTGFLIRILLRIPKIDNREIYKKEKSIELWGFMCMAGIMITGVIIWAFASHRLTF